MKQSSTAQLLGTLIERTESLGREMHSISLKLDNSDINNNHRMHDIEKRIASLELRWAETTGGTKMAALVFGAAATIGGLVATFAGSLLGFVFDVR